MKRCLSSVWTAVSRTKSIDVSTLGSSDLKRCLNVVDLIALGVGSTLGSGIYVIIGQVAKNTAGPSTLLSVLIASVACVFAALSYAEFAARVPKAGSAYVYSYVSAGELLAFVIGWTMILEGVIGAASVAKTWSDYFDSMLNGTIRTGIENTVGTMNSPGLAEYPDFIAFLVMFLVTIILCVGVKMSSVINSVLTCLNLIVIATIIVVGFCFSDIKNWTEPPGFFPFGAQGVFSGAATCFYGFVGFDAIASSGEEATNPSKYIPRAIGGTLIIVTLSYVGVSVVITLMVPWHELPDHAVLPTLFASMGIAGVEYVISIGGLCGMIASLIGSVFPVPRIIYAMSQDGLLFSFLSYVNPTTKTPIIASAICGLLAAIMASFIDLQSLVQMFSIGTLMAYTLVSVCVILLRYKPEHVGMSHDLHRELSEGTIKDMHPPTEDTGLLRVGDTMKTVDYIPSKETTVIRRFEQPKVQGSTAVNAEEEIHVRERVYPPLGSTYHNLNATSSYSLHSVSNLFNVGDEATPEPTERTSTVVTVSLLAIIFFTGCLCLITVYGETYLASATWWSILLVCIFGALIVCFGVFITRQPQNSTKLVFECPLVPLFPLLSVMINIYLMMSLSGATWIRFAVWMAIGFLIYFSYGIWHSRARSAYEEQKEIVVYGLSDRQSIVSDDTVSSVTDP